MGLQRRPKTGRKFDGSKMIIQNNGVKTVVNKDVIEKVVPPVAGPNVLLTPPVTPTNTPTPSITPTNTPTPSITPSTTLTPSITPSNTATPTTTPPNTPSNTPSKTLSPSKTPTKTPRPTPPPTRSPEPPLPSISPTPSITPTYSLTASNTPTPPVTPSNTPTNEPTKSVTPTSTVTPSNTKTPSPTRTIRATPSPTNTETPTNTPTKTPARTPSNTPTIGATPTATPTNTRTLTRTPRETRTPSPTRTERPLPSSTATPRATTTPSTTQTKTPTPTRTRRGDFTCECWGLLLSNDGGPCDGNLLAVQYQFSYYDCNGNYQEGTGCQNTEVFIKGDQPTPFNDSVVAQFYGVIVDGSACPNGPPASPRPTRSLTPTRTATRSLTPTSTITPTNTPSTSVTPTNTPTKPDITQSSTPTPTPTIPTTPSNTPTMSVTPTNTPSTGIPPSNTPTTTPTPSPSPPTVGPCVPVTTGSAIRLINRLSVPGLFLSQTVIYTQSNTTDACTIYLYYTSVNGALPGIFDVRTASGALNVGEFVFSVTSPSCECLTNDVPDGYYFYNSSNLTQIPPQSQTPIGVLIQNCEVQSIINCTGVSPQPLPTRSQTPTNTPTISLTPTNTPSSPNVSASPTPTNTPSPPNESPTPTSTNTPTVSGPCTRPTGLTLFPLASSWSINGVLRADFVNIYSNGGTYDDVCLQWNTIATPAPVTDVKAIGYLGGWTTSITVGAKIYADTINDTECDCILNGFYVTLNTGGQALTTSPIAQIQIITVVDCFITEINTCSNPSIAGCSVLLNSNQLVYLYDQPTNVATQLIGVTNTQIGVQYTDIAHSTTKMWMTEVATGIARIREWNITLSPFTATFSQVYTPSFPFIALGAGLCLKEDNVTLIISNAGGATDNNNPRSFYEFNTSNGSVTFKFNTYQNRRVSGDMILTTTGKLIVISDNGQQPTQFGRQQWIEQYNYVTGEHEFEESLTPYIQVEGGYFLGMFQIGSDIFIQGASGTLVYQYKVSISLNPTIEEVPTPSFAVFGSSQLPECITQAFPVNATPLSMTCNVTNVSVFGANDGILNVTTVGGTPPYTYTVNGTATTLPSTGRGPGSYVIVVTDSVGGTSTVTCPITEPACTRPGGLTTIYYAIRFWTNTVNGLPSGAPRNFGVTSNSTNVGCTTYNLYFQQWAPNGCPVAIIGGTESGCGGGLVDVTNYNTLYNFNTTDINSPSYYPFTLNVSTFYTNNSTSCGCGNFAGNANMWVNATNPTQQITVSSGVWTIKLDPLTCKVIEMNKCSNPVQPPQLLLQNRLGVNPMTLDFNSGGVGGGVSTITASINWNDFADGALPVVGPTPSVYMWANNTNSGLINYNYNNTDTVKTSGIVFSTNVPSETRLWMKIIQFQRISKILNSSIQPFNNARWSQLNQLNFSGCSMIDFTGIGCPENLSNLQFSSHAATTMNLNWTCTNALTNLTSFQFISSTVTTSLNFNFSGTKLIATGVNGESQGIPLIRSNSELTTLTMTLPTLTNTLTHISVYSNAKLATLTMNEGVANSLSTYTTLDGLFFHSNALTSWPYQNFNATNNIQYIQLHSNIKTTITNSGFRLGLNIDFNNLTKLIQFYAYNNKISNTNSSLTNLTSCTLLQRFWVYDNLLDTIPQLPNTSFTSFDLRIYTNSITINSSTQTSIPPLPSNLTTFYVGLVGGSINTVNYGVDTNTISFWPTNLQLSGTKINDFYCRGVKMSTWADPANPNSPVLFPTTTTNLVIYLQLNNLQFWDFDVCTNAKQVWLNRQQNTSTPLTYFLTELRNVNSATNMTQLEAAFNNITNPSSFFGPTQGATSRVFPTKIQSLNLNFSNISTANQPWTKALFSTSVVNDITSFNLASSNLTTESVNRILDFFKTLITTTPAGQTTTVKANSCAPNLASINLSNLSGVTERPNQAPNSGTAPAPNGCNARTILINAGVIVATVPGTCP